MYSLKQISNDSALQGENPIYKQATSTFVNPTYRQWEPSFTAEGGKSRTQNSHGDYNMQLGKNKKKAKKMFPLKTLSVTNFFIYLFW